MPGKKYTFAAKVWLYSGMAAWHFITLPRKESEEIKELFGEMKRGWGSLPVEVMVRNTTWRTSIFPDKKRGAYLLPLKSAARKKEKISEGDMITLVLEIKA